MKLVKNGNKSFSLDGGRKVLCPRCGGLGKQVRAQTVRSLVLESLAEAVEDQDYYLCLDEACEVAYFAMGLAQVLKTTDIKVPLWFKNGAAPKYACYCSKVTEDQVRMAVVEGGARTVAAAAYTSVPW